MALNDCIMTNNQDFCTFEFETEEKFNEHVLEHFVKKNCSNCNKMLIRVGSQWYELHIDELKLDDSDDHKYDIDLNSIVQVNIEKYDDELDFNDSGDHDVNLNNEASYTFDINDSDAESLEEIKKRPIKKVKSSKQKKSAKVPKTKSKKEKQEENKSAAPATTESPEKTTQKRRRGQGPLSRIQCRICERIILKYNFELHLRKMHVPNIILTSPVKCETCGKGFASSGNLKIHQQVHSGTKRFVCSYCGASFRQHFHLKEHINAHTGSTPYQCKVCNKQFTRHTILKAHQLVHTGEKPHKCNIEKCDRAYAYEIDLKRHKFSVHGIYSKKHICALCEKVFPEKKLLRKHLESHSAGNIRLPCQMNE